MWRIFLRRRARRWGGWAKAVLSTTTCASSLLIFLPQTHWLWDLQRLSDAIQFRELIPQAEHWPSFVRNRSEQFEGRVVMVRIEDISCPWLNDMAGSVIPVAVAHGEGRAGLRTLMRYGLLRAKPPCDM